jgi:hypothetical protein
MTTIKKICNYSESVKPALPFAELYYLDYTIKNSDSHNREAKRINRELMIDVVLGLESDSGVENKFIEYLEDDMYSTVTSEIMSIRVQHSKFTTEKDLERILFLKLDKLTDSKRLANLVIENKNVVFDYSESVEYNMKKVVSRIGSISNLISIESRGGYVNTIIIGSNILELPSNISAEVIRSSLINPDKIIIMNIVDTVSSGLIVVNNINDNSYYMQETPNWNRHIKSFLVK